MQTAKVIDMKTLQEVHAVEPVTWQVVRRAINYPTAEGYVNGCAAGKAIAYAYVLMLKAGTPEDYCPGLAVLVREIEEQALEATTKGRREVWNGKLVGLLGELDRWLKPGVKLLESPALTAVGGLTGIETMLAEAADGKPERDMDARIKAQKRAIRSRGAKAGWARRKAAAGTKTH